MTIDTTGLASGRHLLFVRGIDTDGNRGVVAGPGAEIPRLEAVAEDVVGVDLDRFVLGRDARFDQLHRQIRARLFRDRVELLGPALPGGASLKNGGRCIPRVVISVSRGRRTTGPVPDGDKK